METWTVSYSELQALPNDSEISLMLNMLNHQGHANGNYFVHLEPIRMTKINKTSDRSHW